MLAQPPSAPPYHNLPHALPRTAARLCREHDLDAPDAHLLPMLDCAHAVFNAVTGVSVEAEVQEVRAFRPVLEWRAIVEAAGLLDSRVYEMQPHDPTVDVMMAFIKPSSSRGDQGFCEATGSGAGAMPLIRAPAAHVHTNGAAAAAQAAHWNAEAGVPGGIEPVAADWGQAAAAIGPSTAATRSRRGSTSSTTRISGSRCAATPKARRMYIPLE